MISSEYISAKIGPDDKLQLLFYDGDAEDQTHGVGVQYCTSSARASSRSYDV